MVELGKAVICKTTHAGSPACSPTYTYKCRSLAGQANPAEASWPT
jgi:hypothetical protein